MQDGPEQGRALDEFGNYIADGIGVGVAPRTLSAVAKVLAEEERVSVEVHNLCTEFEFRVTIEYMIANRSDIDHALV